MAFLSMETRMFRKIVVAENLRNDASRAKLGNFSLIRTVQTNYNAQAQHSNQNYRDQTFYPQLGSSTRRQLPFSEPMPLGSEACKHPMGTKVA